jgi:hypothetical protein
MGIEPTLFAWEARVLPLNDTRMRNSLALKFTTQRVGESTCQRLL